MAVSLETLKEQTKKLAEQLRQMGQGDIAVSLEGPVVVFSEQAAVARQRGIERIQNPSPELEVVVFEQVEILMSRYQLHQVVYSNLNDKEAQEAYRRDFILPDGAAMPEEYTGRFDGRVLVVDPRVDLSTLHEKAGVTEYIDTSEIINLTKVPKRPYVTFTHDSQKYRLYSVEQALTMFAEDEVGKPQVEITYHYLQFPEDFTKDDMFGMNAAGSRYGDGDVPNLYLLGGRPLVNAHWIDNPFQYWGAGSRGKEVIELCV